MNIFLNKNLNSNISNNFYLILGSFFFSLMTVCVKKVDSSINIIELVYFRSIFSLVITSLILKKRGINSWGFNKKLLILRGLLGTLALICIFYSIRNMPLSISTVIQYTYPIFISIFAIFFLNEKFSSTVFYALFLGWIGIMIILNPYQLSFEQVEITKYAITVAFIGSITTSLAYITVKKLSETEDVYVIIKYFPLISCIFLTPIVFTNWVTPNPSDFIWIFGIGFFTQAGQTFLTLGLKKLPASKAGSVNYMQVVFASMWGIFIFSERIKMNFIIGSLLVLLGTIITTSKLPKKF